MNESAEQTATALDLRRLRSILWQLPAHVIHGIIMREREQGRAFGVTAEACRAELAKRSGVA